MQNDTTSRFIRLRKAHHREQIKLLRGGLADACVGTLADGGAGASDAAKHLQRRLRLALLLARFEAHAHHPVVHQSEEADQRVGADAIRAGGGIRVRSRGRSATQSPVRCPPCSCSVTISLAERSATLVTRTSLPSRLGASNGFLIDAELKTIRLIVGFLAGQFGVETRALKAAVGTAVGGAATALHFPSSCASSSLATSSSA